MSDLIAKAKPYSERQQALAAEVAKIERDRDQKVLEAERLLAKCKADALKHLTQVKDERLDQDEELGAELALEEFDRLVRVMAPLIAAGAAASNTQLLAACDEYISCHDQSADLMPSFAGSPMIIATDRLFWVISAIIAGEGDHKAGLKALENLYPFVQTPDTFIHPHQIDQFKSGELPQSSGYKPQALLADETGRLCNALRVLENALLERRVTRVIEPMRLCIDLIETLCRSPRKPEAHWNCSDRIYCLVWSGSPDAIMQKLRFNAQAEDAIVRPEREKLEREHSKTLAAKFTQLPNSGADSSLRVFVPRNEPMPTSHDRAQHFPLR